MMSYKYRIVEDGGFKFQLLPNNSNIQYVVESESYKTKADAIEGISVFKSFLSKIKFEELNVFYNEKLNERKTKRYSISFVYSQDGRKICSRWYCQKHQQTECLTRIFENYNALLRIDL